jgi:hypothetical protein
VRPWLIIAVAVLAFARESRAQLLSPGPLHQGHASVDSDNDCGKCHASGNKVVGDLCLSCHKDLAKMVATGRGLHGRPYKGKPCEECHVEHLGRTSKLVRWPGGAMEKLDHAQTGYKLEGGHIGPKCLDCHKKKSSIGTPQFANTNTTCVSCHKDPHTGKFGAECTKCHGVSDWNAFQRNAFDHALAQFPLTGTHAQVACEKCHTDTPPKWKPLAFATCESCHKDPHAGAFKPKPCTTCHDTNSWEAATDVIRKNHPGLSLAAGHAKVECKTCHDRGNDKPPSKGKQCDSCHRPVHIAKFGTRCESCHASIRWVGLPESIGRDAHDRTRYPLAGKHERVACESCHPKATPLAKRFRGVAFDNCSRCHADKHAGEFKARNSGECSQCHTVKGFTPTLFGIAQHQTTQFTLDGKHAATPCGSCHPGAKPRLAWKVAAQRCVDCHANPHGNQFDKEMAQGGCAKCHTTFDWHQPHIDHSTWPLVGAHTRATCASCHGAQAKGAQPAAYRGVPRDCEGCHTDIHARQFADSKPVKRCSDCHNATTFHIAATFDHSKTRYPLEGKHVEVACGNCHLLTELRDGKTAVRWRLGYTECRDCHANPHREGP